MTTITNDMPPARSRRLTRTTAATAYRPANLRPAGYRGQRRRLGLLATVRTAAASANPVWLLGMAAGALWATAAVLATSLGMLDPVLPW